MWILAVTSWCPPWTLSSSGEQAKLKGYAHRLLTSLKFSLFCMEEYGSYDIQQVVTALTKLSVKTLLMVGDVYQRVELSRHGAKRATFNGRET